MRVVISPHLDDAIFSCGERLADGAPTTIACPFAGSPADAAGQTKYRTLRREHAAACVLLDVHHLEGPFLDDVYPNRNIRALRGWISRAIHMANEVWVPLGIHHPDHVLVSTLTLGSITDQRVIVYEELPYRVLYPDLTVALVAALALLRPLQPQGRHLALDAKRAAVGCYRSQLRGGDIARSLFVPERAWVAS